VESSVLDLRLDQKIDGASGCLHSCMHCGEAQGDTMELACTACCTARLYNLVCGRVSLSGLWPKAELGSTHGIGLGVFYSVSEWNADKTRVDKVRYWTAVARLFDLCRSGLWRLDLWRAG
jgi:hypothetical protein